MKRLLKVMVVAVLALPLFVVGVPVSAQQASQATCEIGYTGPDSNNMCTSTTEYTCEVTNENTVTISSSNNQDGASGQVSVTGNTSGGNGVSGTVTNENGTVYNVTITNSNPDTQEWGVCTATVTVPATNPPAPVQPTGGSGGAGGGGGGEVAALPVTSGDATLAITASIAGVAALLAVLSVGGVVAYRHFKPSA